jgi:hypothetical protein
LSQACVPRAGHTAADDPQFVTCVDRIVAALAFRFRPRLLCLVRIQSWFDHRWLRGGAAALTFPAFPSARIAAEHHFARVDDGSYEPVDDPRPVHHRTVKRCDVRSYTRSGLFVWYSSDTARNRRGSVLTYAVSEHGALPWFASLVPRDDAPWRALVVKGLEPGDVTDLMTHPLAVAL